MAIVDHNFGEPVDGQPALLAVPISPGGSANIEIINANGRVVGKTKANKIGFWLQSFELPGGTYTVNFTGAFRPVGVGKKSVFFKPTNSQTVNISVPSSPDDPGTGPQGPPGQAGPAGEIGETGPTGDDGVTGPEGPAGTEGPIGITGPAGEEGEKGDTGEQGPAGEDGSATTPLLSITDLVDVDAKTGTGATVVFNNAPTITGNIAVDTVDGRDISTDGTKLDTIETNADVTDATNVANAGAVMDGDFSVSALMVRTGAGTYTNRSIAVGSIKLTVSNGDGVSGNPTLDFGSVGIADLSDVTSKTGLGTVAVFNASPTFTTQITTPQIFNGDTITIDAMVDGISTVFILNSSGGSSANLDVENNIIVGGTVDGRDLQTDGTKLDTIETNADVTDATNVNAAGAFMNSDTQSKGISVADPTATEDILFYNTKSAITISRIYGETDTGTVTFKIFWRAEGSLFTGGTNVHATGLVADSNGEEQTSGFADPTIPVDSTLVLVSSAVASSPTKFAAWIEFTID